MKKLYFIIFISLFISVSAFSQYFEKAPGYQGKTVIANTNFSYSPALFAPNKNGVISGKAVNLRTSIGGEYIIDKKRGVGIQLSAFKTAFEFDYPIEEMRHFTTTWSDDGYEPTRIRSDGLGYINAKSMGLYYKSYFNHIAPLGAYFKIQVDWIFYKVNYDSNDILDKIIYDNGHNNRTYSPEYLPNYQLDKRYTAWSFNMKFGNQRILFDRIVLDYGIDFGTVLKGISGNSGWDSWIELGELSEEITTDNYFDLVSKARLFDLYFIGLDFGIGFLAY
ncbi:MAG: hypothetical protein U9R42_05830 [Bacteroidota bacterium]|nr:hypothetical protein [Bacteroidota bacterium]